MSQTKEELAPKKVTRIDVFYNHDKKPTTTHSANDLGSVLKRYLKQLIQDNKK